MSFCCGASMIGTKGTLKHMRTYIHNVPLLFCPVCHRIEVHYKVEEEYEILLEYAHGDGASEIDFNEYVDYGNYGDLYVNCVSTENEEPEEILQIQIDMALDLLSVAKQFQDEEWKSQLFKRLEVLSQRQRKIRQKKAAKGYK